VTNLTRKLVAEFLGSALLAALVIGVGLGIDGSRRPR
jgi:glycerol uptake facilitator-like aquaporin